MSFTLDDIMTARARLHQKTNLRIKEIWFVDCPALYYEFVAHTSPMSVSISDQLVTVIGIPFFSSWTNPMPEVLRDKPSGVWAIMNDGTVQQIEAI